MKKMKKIFAMLLAFTMILGMTMTASAENSSTATVPSEIDSTTATVANVEATATVTAYQIVKGKYNSNGFLGYEKANENLNIEDVTKPSSDEVAEIAQGSLTGLATKTMIAGAADKDTGLANFTAELEAGYWMVLVKGAVEIYNPMLVGVYYSVSGSDTTLGTYPYDPEDPESTTNPGYSVDANDKWELVTKDAWAKSALPTIDKKINNSDGNASGNDAGKGGTVEFEIDTVIPSYSEAYKSVKVVITDELSAGLTLDTTSIEITIGGTTYTPATGVLDATASGFTLTIPSNDALANSGRAVVITYKATLNEKFKYNYEANTNKATLEYTNNPKNINETNEIDDTTYTYTFGIDAKLNGSSSEVTKELYKVKDTGKVEIKDNTVKVTDPLAGATFTLTRTDAPTGYTGETKYTATSVADGSISFTGLDAGNYDLVETVAPEGYAIEGVTHKVVINATYNEDNGTLDTYTITIDGTATTTYKATYESDKVTVKEITTPNLGSTGIVNTKLIALPSTGGIGTTIFTVAGCGIMIAAAFFFFASRKKEN